MGRVGNVFLFNSESTKDVKQQYTTRNSGTRNLYNLGKVWSLLNYHGILADPYKIHYQSIWEDFGWEFKDGVFAFRKNRKKYIFDIDLDCFSTVILDKTVAIPEEIFLQRMTELIPSSNHHYITAHRFIKDLIKDSEIVTICFENGGCGGIRQAYKIFNMVDSLFFDDELGA